MFDTLYWRSITLEDPRHDPQERAFLRAILDDPDDDATRLVFADWLDDSGQHDKARYVRLEVELSEMPRVEERFGPLTEELNRLGESIGDRWSLALFRPGRLLNCGLAESQWPGADVADRFAFECPNRWVDLHPTADEGLRFCDECRKHVHRCASRAEAERHALRGHCVAIDSRIALEVEIDCEKGPLSEQRRKEEQRTDVVGMLRPPSPYELWAREFFGGHGKHWWQLWG
jgi:uncharacterized protein (TIGR02996 family)